MSFFYYTIPVDPGYMFDFLSIYHVKMIKKPSKQSQKNYEETNLHICDQIGIAKHTEIKGSDEYNNLLNVNIKLFNLVELAKDDKVKASDVDRCVIERWEKKKALQEKFFPDKELNEQKFNKY